MVIESAAQGVKSVFVSSKNGAEALLCPSVTVYTAESLSHVAAHLKGDAPLKPITAQEGASDILDYDLDFPRYKVRPKPNGLLKSPLPEATIF